MSFGLVLVLSSSSVFADQARLNPNRPGAVKTQWTHLMAGGCDVAKANISTPLEARVLRNTPFAIKGKIFKSAELAELFAADGWYKPSAKAPKLAAIDKRCVGKLAKWEKRLRKKLKIGPKVEAFMTRYRELYLQLRKIPYDASHYTARKGKLSKGVSSWGISYSKECEESGECGGYSIDCTEAKGVVATAMKWYRRGRFNVRAGIEILIQRYGIDDRNPNLTVLFVGTSAGGYGVQHDQDILAELLPISSQAGRVRVIADGAWASPWDNPDYPWGDTWSNTENNVMVADQLAIHQSLIESYGGVLLPACTAEANPADCVLGQVSYGYSPLPTMLQKSTRDNIEMLTHRRADDPTLLLSADPTALAAWVAGQEASLATPEWLFSVDQPYHTAMEGPNYEQNVCNFRDFVGEFARGEDVEKRRLYVDDDGCAPR